MASPVSFTTDPELAPLAQAASLTLAILFTTKTATLADLDYTIPGNITLNPGQLDLLDEHREVLSLLRSKTPTDPVAITVLVCPACQRWILFGSGSSGKNCTLTPRCPGHPARVTKAVKIK